MTVTDENGGRVEIDPSQITLNQDGSYAVTADLSSLADGTLKVTVSGKDAYGNTAAATDEILKDTVCPVTIDLAPSSDTGESDSDDLTRDDTPTLQGETDPGAVVTVYRDGEAIGTTTADADGRWSFRAPSAIDRPVTTKVEDSADSNGNELNNTLETAVVFDRSEFGAFARNFGGSDDVNGREVPQNVKNPDTLSARFVGAINNVDPEGSAFPTDGHVDQDWVKVSLKAGEKLILDIDYGAEGDIWNQEGSVDTEVRIFDAQGRLVQNVDEHIYNHVEGTTTDARQDDDLAPMDGGEGSQLYDNTGADARTLDPYYEFTVPEDGDYYIQVSAFNNGDKYDSGTYELWMSIENPKFDYMATAVDPYGNSGSSDTLTVTLETTLPAVSESPTDSDDILYFEPGHTVDGLAGDDTMILHRDESIDFSNLPGGTKVENMEKIDLTINGDHELKDLTLEDVIEMTDDRNTLVIEGTDGDKVDVPVPSGNYSVTHSTDGGYDVYTYSSSSGDPTVTLKIDQDVQHGG